MSSDSILQELNIFFIRQKEVRGLGDAVRYAESFVAGDPFAVMLGDTITIPPCIQELMAVYIRDIMHPLLRLSVFP